MISTMLSGWLLGALMATPLADGWQREYDQAAARAPHVIALWPFNKGSAQADASGHGHELQLSGAEFTPDGKFGGGLRSFPGWPVQDKRHAAVAKNHASLSPMGAFTIDLWLKPEGEIPSTGTLHLLCKKYVSNNDYQLALVPSGGNRRSLLLNLGFGEDSEGFRSTPAEWPVDVWQHIAVTYDGAGTVRFYRNGASLGGRTSPARRGIAPGKLPLTIADRSGSNYGGFPGVLDQVRLSSGVREFSPASVAINAPRTAYLRMEPGAKVTFQVHNHLNIPLTGATLEVSGMGSTKSHPVPEIAAGKSFELAQDFDTRLRPGTYELLAKLEVPGDPLVVREESLQLTLAPRPISRMPVVMWGIGGPEAFEEELGRLQELGFTHSLGFSADPGATWKAKAPAPITSPERAVAIRSMLDRALAHQFGIAATLAPGHFLDSNKEVQRVDRNGKPYPRENANAALPGLAEFGENLGKSVAQTFGDHPAFQAALINTEVRDGSQISFSEFDRAAYRKVSGQDFPEEVTIKNGVEWGKLKGFPANRVIPDDHPILTFYRWFWTVGDGWNGMHSAVHRGLKSTGRKDLWTWFDPAIRAPSIAGSGGKVDVLSQWTYTEPSPLRVGYFADEVFAMAGGSPQLPRVMKMTQLFWYRTSSAPIRKSGAAIANPFDDHDPDAAYISIAPGHLRESFWTKIARPVTGLMYHGWASLVPTDGTSAYKLTQLDLQTEFRRLHREVLEPLGPFLLQTPARPADVAYLDSFTAQMFARRGSYGYSHDETYLTLLHAQLQPEVIFEETLLKHGLDAYRVLVLADCDVLPKSVADRILAFQKKGGIIIGDPNLAPAIRADITIPRYTRTRKAEQDKKVLLANAAKLRKDLAGRYEWPVSTSNPEIVPRLRRAGTSDYVFLVNDQREAGTYVGQHGMVQDQGVPSAGTVTFRRKEGTVYDLTARHQVPTRASREGLTWDTTLGPCDGNVYLVTARPIERVDVQAPNEAGRESECRLEIKVTDAKGEPVDAVIPLEVRIFDPNGRPAEFSGYHATLAGTLTLTQNLASNDTPGVWTVQVRELATGLVGTHYVRVK